MCNITSRATSLLCKTWSPLGSCGEWLLRLKAKRKFLLWWGVSLEAAWKAEREKRCIVTSLVIVEEWIGRGGGDDWCGCWVPRNGGSPEQEKRSNGMMLRRAVFVQLAAEVDSGDLRGALVFFRSLVWDFLSAVAVAKEFFVIALNDRKNRT